MKASLVTASRIALCLGLNVAALILAYVAHPIHSLFTVAPLFLISGLLLTVFLSVWYQGAFLSRLKKALFPGYALGSTFFIIGYFAAII